MFSPTTPESHESFAMLLDLNPSHLIKFTVWRRFQAKRFTERCKNNTLLLYGAEGESHAYSRRWSVPSFQKEEKSMMTFTVQAPSLLSLSLWVHSHLFMFTLFRNDKIISNQAGSVQAVVSYLHECVLHVVPS